MRKTFVCGMVGIALLVGCSSSTSGGGGGGSAGTGGSGGAGGQPATCDSTLNIEIPGRMDCKEPCSVGYNFTTTDTTTGNDCGTEFDIGSTGEACDVAPAAFFQVGSGLGTGRLSGTYTFKCGDTDWTVAYTPTLPADWPSSESEFDLRVDVSAP
jgi:hypothetical protein